MHKTSYLHVSLAAVYGDRHRKYRKSGICSALDDVVQKSVSRSTNVVRPVGVTKRKEKNTNRGETTTMVKNRVRLNSQWKWCG